MTDNLAVIVPFGTPIQLKLCRGCKLRERIEALADEWAAARTNFRVIAEDLAKNQAAKELRALLAETEAK